jgi:3-hydroxyisobutyrate dehydrogenase-like beta-hydroxyacid dehydrogenase
LNADVVITMLADDSAVRAIWLDSGLAQSVPAGRVHLNMATTGLGLAHELLAAHALSGSIYVSAPVFGRPSAAEQGQLDIIAAGPANALQQCRPLFESMGKQVFEVGQEPHKSNAVKIARNFLLATVIESLGESFALVRKAGVSEADFVAMRTQRDATLEMPVLILPAVQINIRAGELPPKEDNGIAYAKIPLNAL